MSLNQSSSNNPQTRSAPWFSIADREIVSVEHPAVVRNLDKGLATLGGDDSISQIVKSHRTEDSLPLRLNPDDVMCRPVHSTCSPANDVLLKVTVPKWTGRKRRRGTNDPFVEASPEEQAQAGDARHRIRSLRDNNGKYNVQAVGSINRTHVFRAIPDFVYSTTASPFAARFRQHILPFQYDKLQKFDIDMTRGVTKNADLIPPPSFSRTDVPFLYSYRQNYSVKQAIDSSGKLTTVNLQHVPRIATHLIPYDVPSIPSGPHPACQPFEETDEQVQEVVGILRGFFAERPAYPRRALRNKLGIKEHKRMLRHSIPYVAYVFRSGPWKDAIIRFGYDPRTERDSWVYQTFMFRFFPSPNEDNGGESDGDKQATLSTDQPDRPETPVASASHTTKPVRPSRRPQPEQMQENQNADSHIFTGHPPVHRDGKMWMVCDIHDSLLRRILYDLDGRFPKQPVCDLMSAGWYGNVTHAIVRVIMRAKFQSMMEGRKRQFTLDDATFDPLLSFPTHVDNEEDLATKLATDKKGLRSFRYTFFATEVRTAVRSWIHQKYGANETGGIRNAVEGEGDGQGEDEGDEEEGRSLYRRSHDDEHSDGDFEEEDEREAEAEAEAMEDAE